MAPDRTEPPPCAVRPRRRPAFHSLRVAAVRPLCEDAVAVGFEIPAELAEEFAHRARPVADPAARSIERARRAPLVLDLLTRRCGRRASGCASCPAGCSPSWLVRPVRPGDTVEVMAPTLPEITEALVATYTECSRTSHLGHKPLPSREAVVEILADSAGHSLSGLLAPAEPAHRQRRVSRRRPDRRPARQADAADRPRPAPRARRRQRAALDLEALAQQKDDRAAATAARACATCWSRTCRPPSRATRRPRAITRSSSAIPAWRRSRSIASPTSCCCWRAADPAHDDRVRPLQDRHRHPSRRPHRPGLLHRPRHRRGHRRDLRHRQQRQALPGRDAGRAAASRATPPATSSAA